MDPEHSGSGFTRSIVLKSGLASSDVLANARGSAASRVPGVDPVELAPTLARAGIDIKLPTLTSTSAGTTISYKVPYTVEHRKELPKKMMASVRWDAIDLAPLDPTAEAAAAGAESVADPDAMPDLGLVTPERAGDVVAPVKIKLSKKSFAFKAEAPSAPGRYRLTVTLHDGDGVAFDPITQAQLPALIVRVTGDLDAEIVAPATAEVEPGSTSGLSVWVANLGVADWGHPAVRDPRDREGSAPATMARLTGTWVPLGGTDDPDQIASAAAAAATPFVLPAGMEPGAVVPAELALFAPSVAGDYLLILDVLDPDKGSLIANGVEPTIIRVKVAAAPPPAEPAPAPTPDTLVPGPPDATNLDASPEAEAAAAGVAIPADETSFGPVDPASVPSPAPVELPAGASRP
jgi:hypothetical protein